jgi:bifunctional non-homologous end joining protein LigD
VAPYAVRALPGAPVATPIRWDELRDPRLDARAFTVRNVLDRLARDPDPWAGMRRHARSVAVALRRLRGSDG